MAFRARRTCTRPVSAPTQIRDLGRLAGRLVIELPAIRRALRHALGLGTGVGGEFDHTGSRRGSIVLLEQSRVEAIGFEAAVIVTEPGYSRQRRQQTVVPLLSGSEFESGRLDVFLGEPEWAGEFSSTGGSIFAATSLVTTVFEPEWIRRYTGAVVDPATMHAVDDALALHLGL